MDDVGRVGEPTGLGSAGGHSGQTSCPDPSGAIPRAFLAEHEAWFEGERRAYRDLHPVPVVAWDGSSLYRQIQNHTDSFFRRLRPLAEQWWQERGYQLDWNARAVSPLPRYAASAIEARRAETTQIGSVHESAVADGQTPNLSGQGSSHDA